MESYDLVVLGGGPGGISAAIRAARRGAKACLIDAGGIGGTCLHRGCIPARTFGTTSRLFAQLKKAEELGIRLGGPPQIDLAELGLRKEKVVARLQAGLSSLLQKSKVTVFAGTGVLQSADEIEVRQEGGATGFKARSIVLATGSSPAALAGFPIDHRGIVTSDDVLNWRELPRELAIVGAGVIGCEFASFLADLGCRVTLAEAAERILPGLDADLAQAFQTSLTRRGVNIRSGIKVGRPSDLGAPVILVAVGRTPHLPEGSESLGIKLAKGGIPADETLRTVVPSIFAVGDLLGVHQLAYTASYEGAVAAENALGGNEKVEYAAVPEAIFTEPEIATVGLSASKAREEGFEVAVARLPFLGLPRAQTLGETEGFIQVVAQKESGVVLGVHMMGARATDVIGEAAVAVRKGLTLADIADTLHPHPAMGEALWEAASAAMGRSIYYAAG